MRYVVFEQYMRLYTYDNDCQLGFPIRAVAACMRALRLIQRVDVVRTGTDHDNSTLLSVLSGMLSEGAVGAPRRRWKLIDAFAYHAFAYRGRLIRFWLMNLMVSVSDTYLTEALVSERARNAKALCSNACTYILGLSSDLP